MGKRSGGDQAVQSVKRLLSRWRRTKGGSDRVAYVGKKTSFRIVENIEVDFYNTLFFKLFGSVFNVDRDVFLICYYVCLQHSPYCKDKDFKCGLQLVEECIMYVNEKYDFPYIFFSVET